MNNKCKLIILCSFIIIILGIILIFNINSNNKVLEGLTGDNKSNEVAIPGTGNSVSTRTPTCLPNCQIRVGQCKLTHYDEKTGLPVTDKKFKCKWQPAPIKQSYTSYLNQDFSVGASTNDCSLCDSYVTIDDVSCSTIIDHTSGYVYNKSFLQEYTFNSLGDSQTKEEAYAKCLSDTKTAKSDKSPNCDICYNTYRSCDIYIKGKAKQTINECVYDSSNQLLIQGKALNISGNVVDIDCSLSIHHLPPTSATTVDGILKAFSGLFGPNSSGGLGIGGSYGIGSGNYGIGPIQIPDQNASGGIINPGALQYINEQLMNLLEHYKTFTSSLGNGLTPGNPASNLVTNPASYNINALNSGIFNAVSNNLSNRIIYDNPYITQQPCFSNITGAEIKCPDPYDYRPPIFIN